MSLDHGGRDGGRDGWRGPLAGLRDVAEFLGDEERTATFLRGLTVGALVGAAIAGSRIWRRRGRRPESGPGVDRHEGGGAQGRR